MADNEQKALKLMSEAEKKSKSVKGFLGSFMGGNDNTDDAIDCYERAGNLFKMNKNWDSAADAYLHAAKLEKRVGRDHDAVLNKITAANCFKKTNPQEAVNCLLEVVEFYKETGKFVMAAKQHQALAELYEKQLLNWQQTVHHYQEAADMFSAENSTASATKCLLKVAEYSLQQEDYTKAIQIYEDIAEAALRSSLLKYSATDYFFRAALCHFCIDMLNAHNAVVRYADMHPAFEESREYKLLKTLIQHAENEDVDAFSEAICNYNAVYRMDESYMKILEKIKRRIDSVDLR